MSNRSKGFSILEVLVVVTVIALLASLLWVAYERLITRGDNTQAQAELDAIDKALTAYYLDNNDFPPQGSDCGDNTSGCWTTQVVPALQAGYLPDVPTVDPWGEGYIYDKNFRYGGDTAEPTRICSKGPNRQPNTFLGDPAAAGDDICLFINDEV